MTDEILENPKEHQNHQASGEAMVIAKHIKKSFDDKTVIKDVSFQLSNKENLAIMGKSGSGKSVLIKCLVGLLVPDGGELEVLGFNVMDIEEEDMEKLRWDVGYLFQGGALYDSMTVERNLKFSLRRMPDKPNEDEINDLVDEVLENVGLIHTKLKMPSELSGGMKKRIALARTLIMKPKIMLYDEPTTGLDIITSNEISDLMLEMREKYDISSIIITHDIACVEKTADRILILEDGEVLIDGKADEVSNSDEKKIRAYFKGA